MKLDRDNLMKLINIESRRSMAERVFSSLGLFVGGALVGAGVALLLAPKSGADLRKDLTENGLNPLLERLDTMGSNSTTHENAPRA